jgi:lipoprotein-anchoring transpeptidase ErfK/SrfK
MRLGRGAVLAGACLVAGAAVPAAALAQAPAAQPPPGVPKVASFRAPAAVEIGHRLPVAGRVTPKMSVPVVIERFDGAAWTPVATLRSKRNGTFAGRVPLRGPGGLRASVAALDGTVSSSAPQNVGLRRRLALRVRAIEYQQIAGHEFKATGRVWPAAPGEKAMIEGSVNGGRWTPLTGATVRNGKVRTTFRPPRGGRWRFRLTVGPRPGIDSGGRASATPMTVAGTNPHGVPRSAPDYLVQKISEASLYYYQYGKLVRLFPVVFGKPSTPTPIGSFHVYSKTAGPSAAFGPLVLWYYRGYGIHGTNEEYLLGRSWRYYSHGCTRNYNANILWLWGRIPVGTPVKNIY